MIRTTVASEWTKLWSVRSTWWALVGAGALMALSSMQVAIWVTNGDSEVADAAGRASPSDLAVEGFSVAQLAVLAVAMLMITGEYSHRTARATLQWTPARTRVLAAKAVVVGVVTAVVGASLGFGGTLVAAVLLGDSSAFSAADLVNDVLAIAASAALLSLLALGLGAALRGAVLTLVVLFLLLVLVPPLLAGPDIDALTWISDHTPGPAASRLREGGHGVWPLVTLLAWAAAALAAGREVLHRRDA